MRLYCIISVFLAALCALSFSSASAQRLDFLTSTPRIDSFPVVRLKMTAAYNGSLPVPGIQPSDLNIQQDANPTNPQLVDCDESGESGVVFCVDVSTSMISSAGDGLNMYDEFFGCFTSCIGELRGSSRYALVTFTDTIYGVYPGPAHPTGFYFSGNQADSASFENALRAQPYFGGTNVDKALAKAASMLQYQPFAQKAIVLVTDDGPHNLKMLDSLFDAIGITLYVMELTNEADQNNVTLTHYSGGTYFQAQDTGIFTPIMMQLGELISGEHCWIRYISPDPCPWYKSHKITLALQYDSLVRTNFEYFFLDNNYLDVTPPAIVVGTPAFTSRTVTISDIFPCESGLMTVNDSLRDNFILFTRRQTFGHYFPKVGGVYVDSNYNQFFDSLAVNDTMSEARAIYIAYDSAGNRGGKEIIYQPAPDINPPQLSIAQSSAGAYRIVATEIRAWDKGLRSLQAVPGATNLVFDSAKIYSKQTGDIWVHIPDLSQPVHGCVSATDSAGNIGTLCIDHTIGVTDSLPPVIIQDPIASPIVAITGTVTEKRPGDQGIKSIAIAPAANTGSSSEAFQSIRQATFNVPIVDSLQPVRAWIAASDSAGNAAFDTLRYDPKPDTNAPDCSVASPTPSVRIFTATELSPWDRGVLSITTLGAPVNFKTSGPVFTTRFTVSDTFTVIDPTQTASVVIQATDSVGHTCVTTITIQANVTPIVPLQLNGIVDFGTHLAPFDSTASISVTNPNEQPVVLTQLKQSGNNAIITSDLTTPLVFQALEKKTVNVTLNAPLMGTWNSAFTFGNDTLTLGTITAFGTTTGEVALSIGSAFPAHSQIEDTISVGINAIPRPINLDSLQFDLVYDGDLVSPGVPFVDCSKPNSLCNYTLLYKIDPAGSLTVTLYRNDKTINSVFAGDSTSVQIPFTTFVTKVSSTPVAATNYVTDKLASVAADTGTISIGNECADQTIRDAMNNELSMTLKSIVPNPATVKADLVIASTANNSEVTIRITDERGVCIVAHQAVVVVGENHISIPLQMLSNGSYTVSLASGTSTIGSLPLRIER